MANVCVEAPPRFSTVRTVQALPRGVIVDGAHHESARAREAARLTEQDVIDLPPPRPEAVEVEARQDVGVARIGREIDVDASWVPGRSSPT